MLGNQKIPVDQAFGKVLRALRKAKGLSQEGLAFEADLQRNYISLIELGTNQPTVTTIFKLAGGLKMRPTELIALVESEMG